MPIFDDFVSADTAPLYRTESGDDIALHLLWGDGVQVIARGAHRTKVRARGRHRTGFVENRHLGGQSLLELYVIDVGQGDGILIKTPNFRHIMVDGGYPRSQQNTGKNAADFVDWKFFEDYALDAITLDAMIISHCDADHYGGLWDLLDVAQISELDAQTIQVDAFYHAGIGWWKRGSGRTLGEFKSQDGEKFYVQLIEDRAAILAALSGGPGPQLQGWWADFLETVTKTKRADGQPTDMRRLSDGVGFLPAFDGNFPGEPIVKILGPVEFMVEGKPAVRRFPGGDSQNTNGNSLLLRLDYGRTRTLLTGDLNQRSQQYLLRDYEGRRQEFECDVTKGCHHGSDDISYQFLQAVHAAVTVISSGDTEGHGHPRPAVTAASATTGFFEMRDDKLISPLVYSTEIARSVSVGRTIRVEERDASGAVTAEIVGDELKRAVIDYEESKSGSFTPERKRGRLSSTYVVADLVYGLVNVRTDGNRILIATRNEGDHTWEIRTINSRF